MPQYGADLVGAGYPISRPLLALLGGTTNVAEPNVGARTNLDWGLTPNLGDAGTMGASPAGGCLSVAVPVLPGDVITKITFISGGTAALSANVGNSYAALYAGTGSSPALLGQSNSLVGSLGAFASATPVSYTLSSPVTVTAINAPYGFVYATYSMTVTAGSAGTLAGATVASTYALPFYTWASNGPRFLAATHNTNTGSVAVTTMSNQTSVGVVPIVILT